MPPFPFSCVGEIVQIRVSEAAHAYGQEEPSHPFVVHHPEYLPQSLNLLGEPNHTEYGGKN